MLSSAAALKNETSSIESVSKADGSEATYKRVELFLIGFASIFITLLWVGVFSSVIEHRQIRFAFLGDSGIASFSRSVTSEAQAVASSVINAASLAKETISYQFVAFYQSSCLTQGTCIGGVTLVERQANGIGQTLGSLAVGHTHRVVAVAENVFSGRIVDGGRQAAHLLSGEQAYAADVLGEKSVSSDQIVGNAVKAYYAYIDSLTFGAVNAVSPGLLQR